MHACLLVLSVLTRSRVSYVGNGNTHSGLALPTSINVIRQHPHRPARGYQEIFLIETLFSGESSSCHVDNHTNNNRDQVSGNDACLEMGAFQLNGKLEFVWHAHLATVTR